MEIYVPVIAFIREGMGYLHEFILDVEVHEAKKEKIIVAF